MNISSRGPLLLLGALFTRLHRAWGAFPRLGSVIFMDIILWQGQRAGESCCVNQDNTPKAGSSVKVTRQCSRHRGSREREAGKEKPREAAGKAGGTDQPHCQAARAPRERQAAWRARTHGCSLTAPQPCRAGKRVQPQVCVSSLSRDAFRKQT